MPNRREYIPTHLRGTPVEETKEYLPIIYAIGEELVRDECVEYGMWNGPNPNEIDMLETEGKTDRSCIIRFDERGESQVKWRWDTTSLKWVEDESYDAES